MWHLKAAVVVERSNSSNSGIDWIVHDSREFETAWRHSFSFRFVFGHVKISVDREASIRLRVRMRDPTYINAAYPWSILHALTREASSMYIYLQTQTHTLQIGPYTHTLTNTQTLHATDLVIQQYATLQRKAASFYWEDIICITLYLEIKAVFNSIVLTLYNIVIYVITFKYVRVKCRYEIA